MSAKAKNLAVVCLAGAFVLGFAGWMTLRPDQTRSRSERRPLASFPQIGTQSLRSGEFMSSFEAYTLDQFPLRDTFRSIKALTATYVLGQKDNNDLYFADGYLSKLEYPMDLQSVSYATARFRYVYERYLAQANTNVYLSVIPDKNKFLAQENAYPALDYDVFLSTIREKMEYATYLDLSQALELSDYYRTDSHWRQEALPDVARLLASQMGVSLSATYEARKIDTPFYGVYYGQAALPVRGDDLYYLTNPLLEGCRVFDYETNTTLPVYDLEKATGDDPYEMFLSGSKSLLTIENPAATTDRTLIVFRDSFGSSLAPLLAEGYQKITLVDIRYLLPDLLGNFISFENSDVLFLYSTSVLNHSVTIK